jgi:hypothetical protein
MVSTLLLDPTSSKLNGKVMVLLDLLVLQHYYHYINGILPQMQVELQLMLQILSFSVLLVQPLLQLKLAL